MYTLHRPLAIISGLRRVTEEDFTVVGENTLRHWEGGFGRFFEVDDMFGHVVQTDEITAVSAVGARREVESGLKLWIN